MEKAAALQILFGELPPLAGGLDPYLEQGTRMKIFRNERISLDRDSLESLGVLFVHTGLLKLAVHRPLSDTALTFCFYGERTVLECRGGMGLPDRSRTYIEACQNTIAYAFSHEKFLEILGCDEGLMSQYDQMQAAQLSLLLQRMELTACLDAGQRVVGWLIQLCRQSEPDGNGGYWIPCLLTQQEIAEYLMIHVTTFNRVFSELKRNGIVEKQRGGLRIHDFGRLQKAQERLSI